MDLSELFKSGFQSLHKQTLEKNYQQKTLKSRMEDFSYIRRQTRDTLLLQKRNLDLNNISPYVTPEPPKLKKASVDVKTKAVNFQTKPKNVETTSIKRLEMLKKWKEDKEKRIQEEKKRAKPIFKVCHVTKDLGLSKFQKEKPVKPKEKFVSKFAPKDHEFQAPKNIKPMYMGGSESPSRRNLRNSSESRRIQSKKLTETRQKVQEPKMDRDKSKATTVMTQKNSLRSKSLRIPLSREINGLEKNQVPELKKDGVAKKIQKSEAKTIDKTKKKAVEWKFLNNGESESCLKSKTNPAKKAYQKTPRKRKNEKNCMNSEDSLTVLDEKSKTVSRNGKTSETLIEKEVVYSDDEISIKTPVRKQHKSIEKSSSKFKTLHGSTRNKTENNETSFESVVTKNQAELENKALTFDDCEVKSENSTELIHTPKSSLHSKEHVSPVNYISPFVTISRGKDSARKEFKVRQSTGGTFPETPEGRPDFSARTSPKMGAEYFTKTLNNEVDRIESICREWQKYKENEIPEEAVNLIDVAVGQSKLLIDKKFKQFRSLIEECKSCQYKEKPITCTDLHGFWDMVYMQVGDLDKRFANLEALKVNDWKEVVTEKKVTEKKVTAPKKTRGRPKKGAASSSLKDAIRAARNKKKCEEASLENPEIILTKCPARGPSTPNLPGSLRRSLRVSLLNGQAAYNSKRASSSPGLTMMKVTQAIKTGDGITPSRSILKSNLNKTEKRITKSVLFKDDLEEKVQDSKQFSGVLNEADKENIASSLNSISFSPVTPTRRSQRLSKKS